MNTHIPKSFQNRIIQALRKLSFSWGPRNERKKANQVGPAAWQCEICGTVCYEGAKVLSEAVDFEGNKLESVFETVVASKIEMNHNTPVANLDGHRDWNSYLNNMFAPYEEWEPLCILCHSWITLDQREERKVLKQNYPSIVPFDD